MQYNGQNKKDKQWSTKHPTEKLEIEQSEPHYKLGVKIIFYIVWMLHILILKEQENDWICKYYERYKNVFI